MSRIFIENLPKNINENELRKRFSKKGEITDIQVKKEKRNAFIGFMQAEQANEAINYFNKTFINSSRISVKLAQNFLVKKQKFATKTDENVDESDVAEESKKQKKPKKFDPFEEVKDDPDFEKFLQVQRNISKDKGKQIWQNDMVDTFNDKQMSVEKSDDEDDDDDDEPEAIEQIVKKAKSKQTFEFTVKLKGLPYKIKKRQLKDFLLPIKPLSMRFVPKVKGIAYMSFKTENDMKQALVKHRGFIDGHRIEITRFQVKSEANNNNVQDGTSDSVISLNVPKWKRNAEQAVEPIGESGRIYVRNLSYMCVEQDLRELFEKFGALAELHMPIDSFTKKPKGFAFVTFVFPEHAVQAFNALDKTDFQGRLLHLLPAHSKTDNYNGPPPLEPTDGEQDGGESTNTAASKQSSFKEKKHDEQKSMANNSANWNTLFIRPNAVADIMAKKFEVNKLDLLTKSSKKDNIAVRMALGETQIVNEVRQFLIENNVSLDSFVRGTDCARSRTVILVKNLPAETGDTEINDLFGKFGLVNRIVLPPYGVTAIVEMQEPNEAKLAFKRLAYNNFKHHPLYLEWAPADVFDVSASTSASAQIDKKEQAEKENLMTTIIPDAKIITAPEPENEAEDEESPEDNTTIFVKNLNFRTTETDLRNHFSRCGRVYSATIATKQSSEGALSMGYGFVQYYRTKDAKEAIKRMQNTELDEHKLECKYSNRSINRPTDTVVAGGVVKAKTKVQKQNGTKICVKNIPFEATVKDIEKIFSVYGQIKSVRLPKKLTGSSSFRGFGFVDFVTKEDAKRAFGVLSKSTHLYGRPLVLEWAKDDSTESSFDDNAEVRNVGAKMARYFGDTSKSSTTSSNKRLKKSDLCNELALSSSSSGGGKFGQADDDDEQ